jgi:ammonia channel protein AmtB
VISTDSLTVIAMVAVLALGTRRVYGREESPYRRPGALALGGLTVLLGALWLAEFASAAAAAVVAIAALVVTAAGLAWMVLVRLRSRASTTP